MDALRAYDSSTSNSILVIFDVGDPDQARLLAGFTTAFGGRTDTHALDHDHCILEIKPSIEGGDPH